MSNDNFINQLKVFTESLLNTRKIREGVLYKYMPFSVFVSMCQAAYNKLNEQKQSSEPAYLDLFCFDAETYNDPREGKILIEFSEESECSDENIGLLAQLYRDTEINKNLVDINTIVFVGSFVFEKKRSYVHYNSKGISLNLPNSVGDALTMWRDYADKGKGVCLEINVDASLNLPLYRVSYDKKEQINVLTNICNILAKFPEAYRKTNASRLREIIDPIRFLFKSSEHDYENEARIIKVCGFNKKGGVSPSNCDHTINLLQNSDHTLSRLYIVFKDFFFKNGGSVIIGPAFEESDYLFGKRVVIKQVYYWLEKLGLLDKVEVKASKYNIRF